MIKTTFFIEGKEVDLDSDVVIPINYAIADIRSPESKNSNFTKTISLPGTTNNNEIFSFLFNTSVTVNSSGTYQYDLGFDPNLKSECVIAYEGAEIFKGYLELNKIVKIDDYSVRYEVTCSGNLVNLFFSIGEKFLSEVDLSEYNHNYTYHIQKASWNNYIYKNGTTKTFQLGDGYVYPYIDYATNNDTDWKVSDFKPAVYVYTILKKIFNSEGFTWTSSFLESSLFKSLIIPYTQGNLLQSSSQIYNRTFRAESTSDDTFNYNSLFSTAVNLLYFQNDSTGQNYDPSNVWVSNFQFKPIVAANYKINLTLNIQVQFNTSSSFSLSNGVFYYLGEIEIKTNSGTVATVPVYLTTSGGQNAISNSFNINSGYAAAATITSGSYSNLFNGQFTTNVYLNAYNITFPFIPNSQLLCKFNPATQAVFAATGNPASPSNYFDVIIKSGSSISAQLADTTLSEGDLVDMNAILPQQVKQKEFVSSIIKMFNLYVDQDKSNSNNFIIEPRDDFYASSGTTRDWTYKLDMSRDLEIIPMGELDAKTYHFTYKDDADYYNTKYKKSYGYNYGHKLYSVRNDHRKNERKTEVIFSATPLADRNSTDRVVPRIFDVDNLGLPVPKTGNIRILYYGGVKNTSDFWNYYTTSGGTTPNVQSTYPYAGHLDNVTNPTIDLSFGMPIEVYYTATAYTDGNLFNRYWRKMINEITDKDSKIIRGYFHLDPIDIMRLDFRDIYYFERDYYRLNKIIDYNPAEVRPTLCEFLKIKENPAYVNATGTITGGTTDAGIGLDGAVVYNEFGNQFNNQRTGQLQSGEYNIIHPSATGALITGRSNYIGYTQNASIISSSGVSIYPNTYDISVLGSSGITVLPFANNINVMGSADLLISGANNVSLIGSANLTIDSSYNNRTVIRNIKVGFDNIVIKRANYTMKETDSGKFIVFTIGVNRNAYLPSPDDITSGWNVELKNNNNSGYTLTLNITNGAVTPVWSDGDGTTASTHVLSAGDSFKYTYDDGIWYVR